MGPELPVDPEPALDPEPGDPLPPTGGGGATPGEAAITVLSRVASPLTIAETA
jgi:hypothetical protein